jgi:ABC-type glycerol-3-phosphate transport system substrate-binding protein
MEMTFFQKVVLGAFFVVMVIGVAYFALQRTAGNKSAQPVTMWGTYDDETMRDVTEAIEDAGYNVQITYREVPDERLVESVLEALAAGEGPDIVMFPSDHYIDLEDKFQRIPYDVYTERDYKDTFIEAGEMFLDYDGVVALPVKVDPLVMYWNRDIFVNAGISRPPEYWDEVPGTVSALVQTDGTKDLTQSAVALGEYQNVTHAKDILQALIVQAGNPIITRSQRSGDDMPIFEVVLTRKYTRALGPSTAALGFYTQFSDPSRDMYSWNRSMPQSVDASTSGDLAMYFGFASELPDLQRKNPNLNYDVGPFPQTRDTEGKRTVARVYGLAIPKNSKLADSAYQTMLALTSPESLAILNEDSVLPPVRRDMLVKPEGNAWSKAFFAAALMARGVYDVKPAQSERIYQEMIESVTGGRNTVDGALGKAESELELILDDKMGTWGEE